MTGLTVGMIGVRFAGLDGVSLEAAKVARVLESLGHSVCWFGGRLDPEFRPGVEVAAARFDRADSLALHQQVFGVERCGPVVLDAIEEWAARLQSEIRSFVATQHVDVLMAQNALAIPMQVPLGLAISRYARASGIRVLSHHHDFAWERERFWPNSIASYLDEAFPAVGPEFGHLVINSIARSQLLKRAGVASRVLPNIMDFADPPLPGDGAAFRRLAGVEDRDLVLLQPTRMVPRKGIEDTLELARRLDDPRLRVIVTHPEPDEGVEYVDQLTDTAAKTGVEFRVVPTGTAGGLADAYAAANLVTYPSRIEGFGNALLEAFYFRRPLLVNRYPVYEADIAPLGVAALEMDGAITDELVDAVRLWINEPMRWGTAVENNYEVGRTHFSYEKASELLDAALEDLM